MPRQPKPFIPHRRIWALIFEETLVPGCRCESNEHLGRFSGCGVQSEEFEHMTDTWGTHGKEVQTPRTRVPASSALRPFQIQRDDKQG